MGCSRRAATIPLRVDLLGTTRYTQAMAIEAEAIIRDLLADLTEPQRTAVLHRDGPLLILAGPGSGKTRVVTRRAAHLACTVALPSQILAITFTNKAVREMKERINTLGTGTGMTVCTFHAWSARLLRQYHDQAGVARRFTIVDRDDRRKLLKQAVEACNLSTTNWSPARVERTISNAKNDLRTAEGLAAAELNWEDRTIARVYSSYEQLLAKMEALDFDDLLMRAALLLTRDREVRGELEDRFRYVLIDEYQDTNAAQYVIARLLTRQRRNICATGDPDQSIYGWRGANLGNILNFERDYPDAKVVRLEQNYRSTKRILSAADAVITGNPRRILKMLWTKNEDGQAVRVVECESHEDEAALIAQSIADRIRSGVPPTEIAVFYRTNALSRAVEEALIRAGIPYQVARGVEFYNRKEIKDVLAYLRVLVNPADEVALLRIINTPPRGIGAATVRRLVERARATGRSVCDLLHTREELPGLGRITEKVRCFGDLLRKLSISLEMSAHEALEYVMSHSGLRAHYHPDEGADDAPDANLNELVNAASAFQRDNPDATIVDWLEYAALVSDVDAVRNERAMITLMTLHAAKGLEFSCVYIIGLEDGLLPFRRTDENEADEEEERRLLFVGMTRARRHLTLSRARYRMTRGVTLRTVRSPFLNELPRGQLDWVELAGLSSGKHGASDRGRLPHDIAEWTIGTLVRHPDCGLGQILSLERGARRTHVKVQFEDGVQRSWVLEFAKLERVDFDDLG